MSEKYTVDRVIFPAPGSQREFLLSVRTKANTSWDDLAKLLGVHSRSLRDWSREKYRMPYSAVKILAKNYGFPLPQDLRVEKWQEHLRRAGINGGKALVKKHGGRVAKNEAYRKAQWRKWWEGIGKKNFHPILNQPLPIKRPPQSDNLAELVGILLGDGGISSSQVIITLHSEDDKEYSQHVCKLITSLFGIIPKIYKQRDAYANDIAVSRVKMVRYCVQKLGLKIGNKVRQQVDIPNWIKNNPSFLRACIRGLVDTDGSVFFQRYRVNGKQYRYRKLSFTAGSKPLLRAVYTFMTRQGLHPRFGSNRDVWLDRQADIQKYFEIIGSSNPKHLKRYNQ